MMKRFKSEAKLTQARYGKSNQPATFDTFINDLIVKNIIPHKQIMTSKANHGECRPKKTIDHKALNIS